MKTILLFLALASAALGQVTTEVESTADFETKDKALLAARSFFDAGYANVMIWAPNDGWRNKWKVSASGAAKIVKPIAEITTTWLGRTAIPLVVPRPPQPYDKDSITIDTAGKAIPLPETHIIHETRYELGLRADGVVVWREVKP